MQSLQEKIANKDVLLDANEGLARHR